MAEQKSSFTRDYSEGRADALNGEVRHEWSEYWSAGYRSGVHDVMCAMAGIN